MEQAILQRFAELEQRLATQQDTFARQAAHLEGRAQAAEAGLAAANQRIQDITDTEQRRAAAITGDVVDTRALGKPNVFSGRREEWSEWSFVFKAYVAAINGSFPGLLERAQAMAATPVDDVDLDI